MESPRPPVTADVGPCAGPLGHTLALAKSNEVGGSGSQNTTFGCKQETRTLASERPIVELWCHVDAKEPAFNGMEIDVRSFQAAGFSRHTLLDGRCISELAASS